MYAKYQLVNVIQKKMTIYSSSCVGQIDQTNKSNIYLERVSFEEYMRLLEIGFIWMYGAYREEVAPSSFS